MRIQERRIHELNVDAAVLHRLDRACNLDQLAGSGFRVSVRARLDELHAAILPARKLQTPKSDVSVTSTMGPTKDVADRLVRRPAAKLASVLQISTNFLKVA